MTRENSNKKRKRWNAVAQHKDPSKRVTLETRPTHQVTITSVFNNKLVRNADHGPFSRWNCPHLSAGREIGVHFKVKNPSKRSEKKNRHGVGDRGSATHQPGDPP